MNGSIDLKKLAAQGLLLIATVAFGSNLYLQQSGQRSQAELAANAQPRPEMLAAINALDVGDSAAVVPVDATFDATLAPALASDFDADPVPSPVSEPSAGV